MEKFGDIINVNTPVLICFYSEGIENSLRMNAVLQKIVTTLKNRIKVVKVDINRNKELSNALKISSIPTVIIFNNLSLIWRGEGFQDSEVLLMELNKFL
ncbi:co-chaperone YbbN [Capnocytophaga sp. oral taxon 878]|uniref:thioredoxin family protein n=1 Tax=Capnocytophaga sp. oral taxon 878 TaxID=1316596 RepID=UPI000D02A675|nr:thioredoxin family protein [Capnocytophaga sp. oral taxon 878]AVM50050.1 thiol reductase thioredoxin [Capnocytophaga sp. oral taxon 878]